MLDCHWQLQKALIGSSACPLLQKEDLARMYRLFQRIPKGLEPVAEIFKKHVEAEGMKLVKEVTEAIQSKKEKDAGERPCSSHQYSIVVEEIGRRVHWDPSIYVWQAGETTIIRDIIARYIIATNHKKLFFCLLSW